MSQATPGTSADRPNSGETRGRGFGIADAMILVAATALAFAITRAIARDASPSGTLALALGLAKEGWRRPRIAYGLLVLLSWIAIPWLSALTPACLLLQWRAPRPPRRRLLRQPGMLACLLATSSLASTLVAVIVLWPTPEFDAVVPASLGWMLLASCGCGAAVFGSWLSLLLGGRWRPARTWPERLGRSLGVCWMGSTWLAVGYLYTW